VLHGDPELPRGVPVPFTVAVDNPLSRPVRGVLGARLRGSLTYGTTVEPETAELEIAPGQRAEVALTVTAGATMPAHFEILRAFWVSELAVCVGQRPVWVRP
jgi:hypothetical protein